MGMTDSEGRSGLFVRPTVLDAGIGVLYFFTSHMVIRALYYIGVDRTAEELGAFFLIVIASMIVAHVLSRPLLRVRRFAESALGVPAVSVVAALGATLALVSMLPVVSVALFYVAGVLLGLACGWIIVIWTSTIHAARPDADSFYLDPALVVAVVCYFLFRLVSSFSDTITQGFLLALPLVTIVCIIRSGRPAVEDDAQSSDAGGVGTQSGAQALQVLVAVAAAFAIGCSVAVYLSGLDGYVLSSGLNYMVLFEVLAVVLIVFCCRLMGKFAGQKGSLSARGAAVLTFCVCMLPLFAIGLVMGSAAIPASAPDALWESNIWVLLIAIFAYDIRDSVYAIRGLAVGLMFEAMCVGQLVARVSTLGLTAYPLVVAGGLTALYLISVWRQLAGSAPKRSERVRVTLARGAEASDLDEVGIEAAGADEDAPSEMLACCRKLSTENGLTPREAEILALIAQGRSAKYIAEELMISYNTTRTHIKHVYEKLNIHTKQELIDLVLFGSGVL